MNLIKSEKVQTQKRLSTRIRIEKRMKQKLIKMFYREIRLRE